MRHLLATQLKEGNPVRQTLLAAAAAFVIGGIATGAVLSQAQQTSPPSQVTDDGAPGPGRTGWAHRMMHQGMMHQRAFNRRAFALIYPQEDRQLAPADVQKIAEASCSGRGTIPGRSRTWHRQRTVRSGSISPRLKVRWLRSSPWTRTPDASSGLVHGRHSPGRDGNVRVWVLSWRCC